MKNGSSAEMGFSLMELMVALFIFGLIGTGVSFFIITTMRRVGFESRLATASQEAKNALQLLSTEARMSSVVSPYIPGTNPDATNCTSALSVTTTSVRFLVVHDDPAAVNGIRSYYVGYSYDAASKQLRRGEIASSSTSSCVLPAGDPTASSVAQPVADQLVPVDTNGDGSNEPVFSLSNGVVSINLGVEVIAPGGIVAIQQLASDVFVRAS